MVFKWIHVETMCSTRGLHVLGVRTQAALTLDDKGRLAVPSELRKAFDVARIHSLVFTAYQGSIWGVSHETASAMEQRLAALDPFSQDALDFTHAVLGANEEVTIDNNGRIRIPTELRELVGIGREVRLISVLDRIELWEPERWKRRMREAQERVASMGGMPRAVGEAA